MPCVCTARERVVGWYSTGPRLREADLDINDLMSKYCDTPLLVICEVQASLLCRHPAVRYADPQIRCAKGANKSCCWVQPKEMGLPTTAYYAKDEIREVCYDALIYFRSFVREGSALFEQACVDVQDGTQKSQKVFVIVPTSVGATEAEEIGVRHCTRA